MAGGLPQPGGEQRSQSKFIVFEDFQKMNTQSIRQSLSEKELAWLENLQPIAGNNLTTVPAPASSALATITEDISTMFYADIGGVDYFIAFTFMGSAYAINIATGAINNFGADGTFTPTPDVTTWQASRILINDAIAGYSTFDGTLFVGQGEVSPNITVTAGGSGYGSAPTVTISGGTGSGATAVAVVSGGSVVAVNLTNPGTGYSPTDTLTVAFGTSPGSGAAATANMTGFQVAALTIGNAGNFETSPFAIGNTALIFTGGGPTVAAAGYADLVLVGGGVTVASVTVTYGGEGYASAPTITVTNATASNPNHPVLAVINAVMSGQSVASVTLTAPGSGYTAPPAAMVVPPDGIGAGAELVTTEAGGAMTSIALVPSPITQILMVSGGNYTASPGNYALIFAGGGGTGATGNVTLAVDPSGITTNVVVTEVFLTAGGTGYTSSPTVTVNASATTQALFLALAASMGAGYDTQPNIVIGSGSGATAIAHVWPFVPKGTTLAVFQGRVWLNGLNTVSNQYNILQWTGTGATYGNVGYDDFLAADASASLVLSDADLIHAITALRSLNNYLFIMGDQSVKQIGNISINTAGDVTLFTILTLSSDQGTIYPKSCISYNRVFMFANTNGIYGVFGSSVQKLSGDMDGIFRLVDFSQPPQGALADINAIHNAVFLVRYKDPLSTTRSIIITFDSKKWFVLSQGDGLTTIATSADLATGENSLYGSSGMDVTDLLADPTIPVKFKIQTALAHHGNAVQGKKAIRAGFSSQSGTADSVTMTVDTEASLGAVLTMDADEGFSVVGGSNDANSEPIGASGIYLGLTITGTLADFTMTNLIIEYQETSLWKGA